MNGPYWDTGFDFVNPKDEQERKAIGIMPWEPEYTTVAYSDDWVIIEVKYPISSTQLSSGDRSIAYRLRILDENDTPIHHGDFHRFEDAISKVRKEQIKPSIYDPQCLAYYEYDERSEWRLIPKN